jgi:hypothetical protein
LCPALKKKIFLTRALIFSFHWFCFCRHILCIHLWEKKNNLLVVGYETKCMKRTIDRLWKRFWQENDWAHIDWHLRYLPRQHLALKSPFSTTSNLFSPRFQQRWINFCCVIEWSSIKQWIMSCW